MKITTNSFRYCLLAVLFFLAFQASATAPNLYEGFNYTPGTTNLNFEGGNTNWREPWKTFGGAGIAGTANFGPATASPLVVSGLVQTGNYFKGNDGWTGMIMREFNRDWNSPYAEYQTNGRLGGVSGTTIWMSVILCPHDNKKTAFIGGGGYNEELVFSAGAFGGSYWTLKIGATEYASTVPVVNDELAFVVCKFEYGATTTVSMYVNPTPGTVPTGTPVVATTANDLSFQFVKLGTATDGTQGHASFDELHIATTYALVAPLGAADAAAPTTPTGLTAGTITRNSIELSWNASVNEIGTTTYDVYKDGVLLANTSNTTYTATGLDASTTYSFTVIAKDGFGSSAATSAITPTTAANPTGAVNFITFDQSIITPKNWPNTESQPYRSFVNTSGGVLGGEANTIPFSTANGGKLFSGTGKTQTDMYGGAQFNYSATSGAISQELFLGDPDSYYKTFRAASSGAVNAPTSIDLLLMWRKDQFTDSPVTTLKFDGTTDSKFSINLTNIGGNWQYPQNTRFVIKNGSQYYISEYVANDDQTGIKELTSFNNTSAAGKRWGIFNPTANDFFIPAVLPTFTAVDFNDVQEVGVIMHAYKTDYGNGIQFSNFTVNGISQNISTSVSAIKEINANIYNKAGNIVVDFSALKGSAIVSVFDIKGSLIKTIHSNGSELLNISVANNGIYLVKIQNNENTITKKVVL